MSEQELLSELESYKKQTPEVESENEFLKSLKKEKPSRPLSRQILGAVVTEPAAEKLEETFKAPEPPLREQEFLPTGPGFPEKLTEPDPRAGALLSAGMGAMDFLRRAVGTAINKEPGKKLLESLADPKSGVLRRTKRAIMEGDDSAATKILKTAGIEILEDPLTLLYGAGVLVNGIRNFNKALRLNKLSDLPREIQINLKDLPPISSELKVKPKGRTELPFTPLEKAKVTGQEASQKMITEEAIARRRRPEIASKIKGERAEKIADKLRSLLDKHGISDVGSEKLMKETAEKLEVQRRKFMNRAQGLYQEVNEKANTLLDESIREIAKKQIDDLGIKQTPHKIAERMQREGWDITDPKMIEKAKFTPAEQADNLGISDNTYNTIENISSRLNKSMTYKELFNQRKKIDGKIEFLFNKIKKGEHPKGTNDISMLQSAREQLTNAMGEHLRNVGGTDLYTQWRAADEIYSKNIGDLRALENTFYSRGSLRSPSQILKEFNKKKLRDKGIDIFLLKRTLGEEGVKPFQQVYFNEIIKSSSSRGKIIPERFVNTLNDQPVALFNEIFTDKMADDLATIFDDVVADQIASRLDKAAVNPKGFLAALRGRYGQLAAWWAMKRDLKQMFAIGLAAQATERVAFKKGARNAENFLRQIEKKNLTKEAIKPILQATFGAGAYRATFMQPKEAQKKPVEFP